MLNKFLSFLVKGFLSIKKEILLTGDLLLLITVSLNFHCWIINIIRLSILLDYNYF